MAEDAVLLIATADRVVVPHHDGKVAEIGSAAYILQIVVAEEVGALAGLYNAAILANIDGNVVGDVFLLQSLERILNIVFFVVAR